MSVEFKQQEWNEAYGKGNNLVFYPHEEVIRFCSKYLRKRVGVDEFETLRKVDRVLSLGCGIGRHVFFFDDMGLEAYGIDLSSEAIEIAGKWSERLAKEHLKARFHCGSAHQMPYDSGWFGALVSHGVLDSLPFALAIDIIKEAERVLEPGGLFYLDLISGDDSHHAREFAGEERVETDHEHGTIQSYFNAARLDDLVAATGFSILECLLIRKENVQNGGFSSRYHVTLRKAESV